MRYSSWLCYSLVGVILVRMLFIWMVLIYNIILCYSSACNSWVCHSSVDLSFIWSFMNRVLFFILSFGPSFNCDFMQVCIVSPIHYAYHLNGYHSFYSVYQTSVNNPSFIRALFFILSIVRHATMYHLSFICYHGWIIRFVCIVIRPWIIRPRIIRLWIFRSWIIRPWIIRPWIIRPWIIRPWIIRPWIVRP